MRNENARWFNKSGFGCDPVAAHGAPVSFTAHGDGLLPGQNLVLDMTGLQNGYRTPYLIDEIRMQAYMGNVATGLSILSPGATPSFQFRVGQYAFSAAPVPMILHQPQYNDVETTQLEGDYAAAASRVGNDARWILAQPLLMMPGDAIQASVFRDASIASGDGTNPFSVDVTYVGRALPPGSNAGSVRKVPWIASFVHDFANAYSHTGTDFRNPFLDRVLNVHRFIGRPMSKSTGGLPLNQFAVTSMVATPTGTKFAAIYMDDSQGYKITDRFVPVGTVFDTNRCTWTFNRPLGPREQYNMQFQTQGTAGGANVLFGVAMHGWREEG